ncbi:ATP-binding cassette domain-containing protein [Marinactinospora thermotolerans]|uniref:ATP-binding cassette domain-containing protein n=1 Tax=Marinactinospora thermotolerans TaxID=531310 RepID=UPI003D92FAC1
MEHDVEAEHLVKRFGEHTAVRDVSLRVPAGSVLGLLGPNGAGKTTTVRMLATLVEPDSGTARVAGLDVVADARRVRRHIGLTGQYATVDGLLTGRQNLVLLGRLLRLGRRGATRRAAELLERFQLTQAADRPVGTYSGGMRRRLDLATCLIGEPRVIFLDEPTTGLDPTSRVLLWQTIREQVAAGTTILLTTQYLEEADQLSDHIVVIDRGRVIAEGTPDQLKDSVGREQVEIRLADPGHAETAAAVLRRQGGEPALEQGGRRVTATLSGNLPMISRVTADLAEAGVAVTEVTLRRPSLDEVFFQLTGATAQSTGPAPRKEQA